MIKKNRKQIILYFDFQKNHLKNTFKLEFDCIVSGRKLSDIGFVKYIIISKGKFSLNEL